MLTPGGGERHGTGAQAARQIADRLDRIPHDTYVEPFLGRGDVFRAKRPATTEVLNDLDCKRVGVAKEFACSSGNRSESTPSCQRVKGAEVHCGHDWTQFLKHDSPRTLFFLDPPWRGVQAKDVAYSANTPIGADTIAQRTRDLKGAVAVYYKNSPEARASLCAPPFQCGLVHRSLWGGDSEKARKWTALLAVKPARTFK